MYFTDGVTVESAVGNRFDTTIEMDGFRSIFLQNAVPQNGGIFVASSLCFREYPFKKHGPHFLKMHFLTDYCHCKPIRSVFRGSNAASFHQVAGMEMKASVLSDKHQDTYQMDCKYEKGHKFVKSRIWKANLPALLAAINVALFQDIAKQKKALSKSIQQHCVKNVRHSKTEKSQIFVESWIMKSSLHAVVLYVVAAFVAFHFSSRAAYAVEATTIISPMLWTRCADILKSFWPKVLQILSVFRDHGLLLSILLGLSAFFSMAETAITTLWPWKVRELADKENEGGVFQFLRDDVTRFLTTILIGTTVANIAATALVTDAATALFGEAGVSAATGVMTVVILLLTEIAPKSIAVHNATEVARFVVRPVAWLSYILYPIGRVVTSLSMSMLKILGLKSSGEPFVTEEELKLMLRGAELSGAIEEEEQDMIENVLEIKDTHVQEVMTPLVDVVAIDVGATLSEFKNLWEKHQYSRVPVFERRVDNIVGIAYAMDMLDYVDQTELLQKLTVSRIAHRPAYFVPDSMSVWNLLREFRIRKVHMAIVLNEYGGAIGVVTLEDVVEEIVGEIFDENDSKEEIRRKTGYIVQRADGIFDVDANTSIEDLTEALEVRIPEDAYNYETVSGFVCEAFGYIPRTGENITVVLQKGDLEDGADHEGVSNGQEYHRARYQKYKLEILAGNARKVGSIRFERLSGSQIKIGGRTMKRVVSRILRRREEQDHEKVDDRKDGEVTRVISRIPQQQWEREQNFRVDTEKDVKDCVVASDIDSELDREAGIEGSNMMHEEKRFRNRYLIAENIDVDAIVEFDADTANGSKMLDTKDPAIRRSNTYKLYNDDIDWSTTAVGTLDKKSQEQERHDKNHEQTTAKILGEIAPGLQKVDGKGREDEIVVSDSEHEPIKQDQTFSQ